MSRSSSHYRPGEVKRDHGVLPRIHDVLGDMLECPTPIPKHDNRFHSPSLAPSSFASTSHAATSQVRLPPIEPAISPRAGQQTPYSCFPQGGPQKYSAQGGSSSRGPTRDEGNHQLRGAPTHSYDVFLLASEHELSHKRSSMVDDHSEVTKELAISRSSGKYLCSECGRRFQKNSTLKNHLTTHSGERPYECPDCRKGFSIASNMRRHVERVHRSGGEPGN